MPSTTTYNFETESKYNYDSNDIELINSEAKLKLKDLNGQAISEDFSSDVGFTYDSSKTEFSGGKAQQIDFLEGSKIGVPFTTDEDATSGGGDLDGTLNNGATVSGGLLDLTGGSNDKYCNWDGVGKVRAQRGAIKFKWTPNYTGNPPSGVILFEIGSIGVFNNQLFIVHDAASAIRVTSRTSAGGALQTNAPFGTKAVTAGTEYEFVYNWDFDNGVHECYIDGTQQGGTATQTGIRSDDLTSCDYLALGNPFYADTKYDDLLIFDEPYVTAPYTPGYSIPEYRYQESFIDSSQVVAPGSPDGTFQSIDAWAVTLSGNTQFTITNEGNQYWFNGTSWEVSNESYAQSSTSAQILANESTLPWANPSTDIGYGIVFENSNFDLSSIDQLDIEYTHQIYSSANPIISVTNSYRFNADETFSFVESVIEPGSDEVNYIMVTDGTKMYWDGAAWSLSNGTYPESNTGAELVANIDTLVSSKTSVGVDVALHSSDGLTTPSIGFASFTYDASLPDPTRLPRLVDINGYVYNNNNPIPNETLQIRPYRNGFNNPNDNIGGGVFHMYTWKDLGTTVSDGYFSGSAYLQPTGEFWEFKIGKQKYRAQLIDKDANDINELTMILVED